MGFGKGKIISGCLKTGHVVLLIAYCLSLIAVFTGCGRRGDPVLVPSYEEKIIKEDSDKKKEEKKAPAGALTGDEAEGEGATALVTPDAPSELAAVYTGTSVVLVWKEVLKQGVKSYRVYRSAGEGFVLAGETVSPAFTDKAIEKNGKYIYKITAVGLSESLSSEEITIVTEGE